MQQAPESIGGYKVIRELGRGAMGTVYLAYQDSLGRDLAIKLMSNEFVRDEEFVERFRREGRIAAKLRHPNIVQVYDFSDRDGLYFIAMEYLGSRTLKCYIREKGRVSLEDAARLTDQLLAALDHAHRQGVVHRDIKPANVMVTDSGDAALTDFSIAQMKSATKLTQTGSVLGTPEYMAPEQFEGKADGRSDLYATGVILYEMLTGFSPFHAETIAEVMKKQLFTAPDPPSTVDFTIPEAVSQVVVKSLAKNPDERYQNAAEMRQALKAALATAGFQGSIIAPIPQGLRPPSTATPAKPAPPVAPAEVAKLCTACSKPVGKQRFCPHCGHDSTRPAPPAPAPPAHGAVQPAHGLTPGHAVTPPLHAAAPPPQAVSPPPPKMPLGPPQVTPVSPGHPSRPPVANPASPPPSALDLKDMLPPTPTPQPPPAVLKSDSPPLRHEPAPPPTLRPRSAAVRFLEDQGIAVLGWASGGCFLLVAPLLKFNNELTQTLASGGVMGMILLMPVSFALSIFLFFRRAGALQVAAPFCVAAGLLIGLLMVLFHLAQNL